MIALLPADPATFTVPGGDAAELMHLTLVYLGDGDTIAAWPEARRAGLIAGVAGLGQGAGPAIGAAAVGHATFDPGGANQCAVHLVGDSTRLAPLREAALSLARSVLGDALPAPHEPWIPHITAGFGLGAGALSYTGPVTFDRLAVSLDDDWHEFRLADPTEAHAHPGVTEDVAVGDPEAEDDIEPITDDELAAMAATALANVADQRDRTHDAAALALSMLLAQIAPAVDQTALAYAYDPDADRAANRAAVAAALAAQVAAAGYADAWAQHARDTHTAAALAGAAAAAHVLTAGSVPVDPAATPFPDPFDPTDWVAAQQGGLAGDLVDAYGAIDLDAVDAELADVEAGQIIAQGDGALYYQDEQISQAYLDASVTVYAEMGIDLFWWNCMGGACAACLACEAASPYDAGSCPSPFHAGCRCWVTPGGPG